MRKHLFPQRTASMLRIIYVKSHGSGIECMKGSGDENRVTGKEYVICQCLWERDVLVRSYTLVSW